MIAFESIIDSETHVALLYGNIENGEDVLVRVHSHCLTGDVFGSSRCHCQQQIDVAMEMIAAEGRGVLLYLHQTGRGFTVSESKGDRSIEYHGKQGVDVNETIGLKGEQREYGIGIQILSSLNIRSMRILTNHPRKLVALKGHGLKIVAQVPLKVPSS